MFSSIPKTNFLVESILSYASSLNLNWTKVLSFGNELKLNSAPNDKVSDISKLRAFARDKLKKKKTRNLYLEEKK